MSYKHMKLTSRIITQKVLNEQTQELEEKEFEEKLEPSGMIGGFNMIYHNKYDLVLGKAVSSNKDMNALIWITNRFTYQQIEAPLSYVNAKKFVDISKSQYYSLVKRLIQMDFISKISTGIYRLNPFIYLPYGINGKSAAKLQREWRTLENDFSQYNDINISEEIFQEVDIEDIELPY